MFQNIYYIFYLAEVKIAPFSPPNVEAATKMGMIHAPYPRTRSANVYKNTTDD